ncbi:MAG: rRNA maturation RNase YbeY [Bacteroidota bacterium]
MIFVSHSHSSLRFSRRETLRTIQSVLDQEVVPSFAVSVVFVGSPFIRQINQRFLKHDYVTDVIAFPLRDGVGVDGEVYVNLDRAKSQARDYGVSFYHEARRLLVHGTLHLLGYRDDTPRTRTRMRKREDSILALLSSGKKA